MISSTSRPHLERYGCYSHFSDEEAEAPKGLYKRHPRANQLERPALQFKALGVAQEEWRTVGGQ